jgi:hypothetical protein
MMGLVFLVLFVTVHAANPASQAQPCPSRVPYGANAQA